MYYNASDLTMDLPHLPWELLPVIARCGEWRVWGKLRVCSKRLYAELSRDDPYAMFTTRTIIDPDLGEIWVSWCTRDGVDIKIAVDSNCGFVILKYWDGRCKWYDYETDFNIDDLHGPRKRTKSDFYVEFYEGVITRQDLKHLIIFGHEKTHKQYIQEAEWRNVISTYDFRQLVKSLR